VTAQGSHVRAAEVVARALLSIGATNLEAKLGALFASFGDNCWINDNRARECLKRWDGRPYHRESIGRARRAMAHRRWIESKRIFPSQHLPNGRRSFQGTTVKRIDWHHLGVKKSPIARPEKREAQAKQEAIEVNPRRRVALDPAFVRLAAGIGAPEAHHQVRTSSPREYSPRSSSSETPAEAKARLAAWAASHEKRGPP
jgi:hypothetical protein